MQQEHTDFDISIQTNIDNSNLINIHVKGDLSFKTVAVAYERTQDCFNDGQDIEIDLNDIKRADSSAMALILEWHRLAKENESRISLLNVPLILKNIASVTDLDTLVSS